MGDEDEVKQLEAKRRAGGDEMEKALIVGNKKQKRQKRGKTNKVVEGSTSATASDATEVGIKRKSKVETKASISIKGTSILTSKPALITAHAMTVTSGQHVSVECESGVGEHDATSILDSSTSTTTSVVNNPIINSSPPAPVVGSIHQPVAPITAMATLMAPSQHLEQQHEQQQHQHLQLQQQEQQHQLEEQQGLLLRQQQQEQQQQHQQHQHQQQLLHQQQLQQQGEQQQQHQQQLQQQGEKGKEWMHLLERSNKLTPEDMMRVQQFFTTRTNPTPRVAVYKMKLHEERFLDSETGQNVKETLYLELDYNTFGYKKLRKIKKK